jgi:TPR repeat protein
VPIHDFAEANEELADEDTEKYYPCCGKSICKGCVHSFCMSGNDGKCPFCKSDRSIKTVGEIVGDLMRRVAVNDTGAICMLANCYYLGRLGLQLDHVRAMELYTRAVELGCRDAHTHLGNIYHKGGNLKKAKFHLEAAAMAGCEVARFNLGVTEFMAGNMERAIKHWTIGASAGFFNAMQHLKECFEIGHASRESMDSTLTAYNSSCAEVRSEARDAYIQIMTENRL